MHPNIVIFGTLLIFTAVTLICVVTIYKVNYLFKYQKTTFLAKGQTELVLSPIEMLSFPEPVFISFTARKKFKLSVKSQDYLKREIVSQKKGNYFTVEVEGIAFTNNHCTVNYSFNFFGEYNVFKPRHLIFSRVLACILVVILFVISIIGLVYL